MALVLFLMGLLLLTVWTGERLSHYVRENMSFSIVLKDNVREKDIKQLRAELEALPFIKSTEYISKAQAAKELEAELGENPERFLGFNPLQASIELKLFSEYANADSLVGIEKRLKGYSAVSDFLYRQDMMEAVNVNIHRLGAVLVAVAAGLLGISFVLISHTIRLLIYSKRFLIHTMQLVGATEGFIRRPFMQYNMVSGVMASVLAVGLLLGALYYLQKQLAGFVELLDARAIGVVCGAIIVLGLLLSVSATALSVNRYLRMNADDLYYV